MITQTHIQQYQHDGYTVVRQLFSKDEIQRYIDHYMALRAQGSHPGDMSASTPQSDDPLVKFPRMIHMHRWDETSLAWMLDERFKTVMTALLGGEPIAIQTMLYFKPPGARGQALHQDQYYLRAKPGTCMAAWLALDRCDEANGCMSIVPGSDKWDIICPMPADHTKSFTDVTVPLPAGAEAQPIIMEPGDVLFFNGTVVHGSSPNITTDRFRRTLIGHYVQGDARQFTEFCLPAFRFDGSEVTAEDIAASPDGGACGTWVSQDGTPVLAMAGVFDVTKRQMERQ